jgi:hypothetical protein
MAVSLSISFRSDKSVVMFKKMDLEESFGAVGLTREKEETGRVNNNFARDKKELQDSYATAHLPDVVRCST